MPLPGYKHLDLEDRAAVEKLLRQGPPLVSELTFTNLYMWRGVNQPQWREHEGCLLVVLSPPGRQPFGLPPAGAGDRVRAVAALGGDLAAGGLTPCLERVDEPLAQDLDPAKFRTEPQREHYDYVYLAEDLANLSGRRFHRKKNHVNKFHRSYPRSQYRPLEEELIAQCLDLQEDWCSLRNCSEDEGLASEDRAVYEALTHFRELGFQGGAILVEGRVAAFSLGEMLNRDTAVIHIEKADPGIPGLYAAINQSFAQEAWSGARFINREQDLGIKGLRAAKESYNPDRLVAKYRVEML